MDPFFQCVNKIGTSTNACFDTVYQCVAMGLISTFEVTPFFVPRSGPSLQ